MPAILSTHIQLTLECTDCGHTWDIEDEDNRHERTPSPRPSPPRNRRTPQRRNHRNGLHQTKTSQGYGIRAKDAIEDNPTNP